MKAWLVREKDEFYSTVVFAETRSKAKVLALQTECCEDTNFCAIEVHRKPQMDKYYTEGKREMDWFNFDDRIAMVKELGFYCSDDTIYIENCKRCPANEYCDRYDELLEVKCGVCKL